VSVPAHLLEISGGGGTVIDDSGNGSNATLVSNNTNPVSLELDYLTITGAHAGLAMQFGDPGSLTLNDVDFTNNVTTEGALDVNEAAAVSLSDVSFTGDSGYQDSQLAGLEVGYTQGSTTLSDVVFSDNLGSALDVHDNAGPVTINGLQAFGNSGFDESAVELSSTSAPMAVNGASIYGNTGASTDSGATLRLNGLFSQLNDVSIMGTRWPATAAGR
jgi:hypothetical protein